MGNSKVIDRLSFVIAILAFGITWVLFFIYTGEFFNSLFAAVINSGLVWITYIMLRVLVLALRRDK